MSTCDDAEVSERRFGLVARQGIFFLQARKNRRRVEAQEDYVFALKSTTKSSKTFMALKGMKK